MPRFEIDWNTCKADKDTLITTFEVVPSFDYAQKEDYAPFRAYCAIDQNGQVTELSITNPGKVLWFGLPNFLRKEVLQTVYGITLEEPEAPQEETVVQKPQRNYKKNASYRRQGGRSQNRNSDSRKSEEENLSPESEVITEVADESV
ncbi:MAG: hypothetical protein IJ022_02995 [Burkholderiaceae bacterium]|nr:hypothetical protein [Burkholderiaceae bacterium]